MTRLVVYGLGHQGVVTAACLAAAGHEVVGLDTDAARVAALAAGDPGEGEPGLAERLQGALAASRLRFTTGAAEALRPCRLLWVAFDTPLDAEGRADAAGLRTRIDAAAALLDAGATVIVSSQVPAGFLRGLESAWAPRGLRFACLAENLRVGDAVRSFEAAERWVVGVREAAARAGVEEVLAPLDRPVEWMSPESAEMAKHALNAWLATSVAFVNELARLCEWAGADVDEVLRGLSTDSRVGTRAYFRPGEPFSGGTLARDLHALRALAEERGAEAPLLSGVLASNHGHQLWTLEAARRALEGIERPVAAVLGLAYKPGTAAVRHSAAVDLALALDAEGAEVRAYDPAVPALPAAAAARIRVCADAPRALDRADLAVIATPWPEFAALAADDVARSMRRPCVIDRSGLLREALAGDPRVQYRSLGRPPRRP